jgi:ATP-dependent DNA helicase DinG
MVETPPATQIRLPDAPALITGPRGAVWLSADGEIEEIDLKEAGRRAGATAPILCHAKSAAAHLKIGAFPAYDLLELFAFVRPAQFCLPTIRGLADVLDLPRPQAQEDEALCLIDVARALLSELPRAHASAAPLAWSLAQARWPWGVAVLAALEQGDPARKATNPLEGFRVWTRLKEWEDTAPVPQPGHEPVTPGESEERLATLLAGGSEDRPEQMEYARLASHPFQPTETPGEPQALLAEAGTGIGKTLGYIAPASVWAEKNEGPVWISTFTRNLQRQLDGELDKLYPDPAEKALKAVVRKGRENYLCLLNLEEAVGQSQGLDLIALGLTARWVMATRDGDMIGGDFPAWLADLLGRRRTIDLTDTRGECIYAACSHYGKCFIEKSVRRARRAKIVVANHALVMIQAALGGDDPHRPTRYVFDEGHHLFEAADSAFSAHLTGGEAAELRRWILGAESRRTSRARGLKSRLDELIADDEKAKEDLDEILSTARLLPGQGWNTRLADGAPHGAVETFLAGVRRQVYARDANAQSPYGLETDARPVIQGLDEVAVELSASLTRLLKPAASLIKSLLKRLEDEAEDLDSSTRQRIEAVARSLERRISMNVGAWRLMLESLPQPQPEEFVDFFEVDRIDGRDFDIGMHRHWLDPTRPFAEQMIDAAQGIMVTSATLRDGTGDNDADWRAAETRTGFQHLPGDPIRRNLPSPFDYQNQTKVFVVTDIDKNNLDQLGAAYRELMLASNGGALGLFTSIARLRGVYGRLIDHPDFTEMMLLAQHVDPLDTGTLVDIFRAEKHACLLGTDAVRDGVDVPGESLRLIVFDRVPWPRPTILHKARKKGFEGKNYDDLLTRLKLKQAYGRLVRRADDRGVFVMLDKAMPSRLAGAFPDAVDVQRLGLADVIRETTEFLSP